MKSLLIIIIVLICLANVCYSQSTVDELIDKSIEYAIQGQFVEAKKELEKALKVNPDYEPVKDGLNVIEDVVTQKIAKAAAIHFFKATSYAAVGEFDKANAEITKSLKINPEWARGYYNRGSFYYIQRQYVLAHSDFNKAIEIDPKYAEAYNNRGVVYMVSGDIEKGCKDFYRACELGICHGLKMVKAKGYCESPHRRK